MTQIYDKSHPHNTVFCEHLQSLIDGTPKTVQYLGYEVNNWSDLPKDEYYISKSGWNTAAFYRIKPPEPVLVTRNVIYPAPMTVAPADRSKYFACLIDGVTSVSWNSDNIDEKWLAAGICHSTRKAAQDQWNAFYGVQA